MRTLVIFLMCCGAVQAGALGLQQAGSGAQYVGPDAPDTNSYGFDFTLSFSDGAAKLDLSTDSPSGSKVFSLDEDVMHEVGKRFYFDPNGEASLALLSSSIDFSANAVSDANIDQVDGVEIVWWDPQFDDGFLTTSLQIIPSEAPNVVVIPEPSALILLVCGVLLMWRKKGV